MGLSPKMLRVGSKLGLPRSPASRTMSGLSWVCVCVCVCVSALNYSLQNFWLNSSAVALFITKRFLWPNAFPSPWVVSLPLTL